jgi:hypothetical protein
MFSNRYDSNITELTGYSNAVIVGSIVRREKLPEVYLALRYMRAAVGTISRTSPIPKSCIGAYVCHHHPVLRRGNSFLDANREEVDPPIINNISPKQHHRLDGAFVF